MEEIRKIYFKYNIYTIIVFLVIVSLISSYLWFDDGIFSYKDFEFPWDIEVKLHHLSYSWADYNFGSENTRTFSQIIIFYCYYLISLISSEPIFIEKIFFTFLLFVSLFSFYLLAFNLTKNKLASLLGSFFYTFNLFYFEIYLHLTSIWFYYLLPLTIYLYSKILDSNNLKFSISFLFSSILIYASFSNIALLVGWYFFLIIFAFFYLGFSVKTSKRLMYLILIVSLINSWYLLPLFNYIFTSAFNEINAHKSLSFSWLEHRSLLNNFSLNLLFESSRDFLFIKRFLSNSYFYITIISTILYGIIIYNLIKTRNKQYLYLVGLSLFYMNLSMGVDSYLFNLIIGSLESLKMVFRSAFEKINIYNIFILSLLLSKVYSIIENFNKKRIILNVVIIFIYCYPILVGYQYKLISEKNKISELPNFFIEVKNSLKDNLDSNILLLPNVKRAYYDNGLKYNGSIFQEIIPNGIISDGVILNNQYLSILFSNLRNKDIYNIFRIKYIINRNNIKYNILFDKRNIWNHKYIDFMLSNLNFKKKEYDKYTIYINNNVMPLFFTSDNYVISQNNRSLFFITSFANLKINEIKYKKINPSTYEINDIVKNKYITFMQTYSKNWKLLYVSNNIKDYNILTLIYTFISSPKGEKIYNMEYSNVWENTDINYNKIIIIHDGIIYIYVGLIISLLVFFILIIKIIKSKRRKYVN